jgi:hypothetical protein
MLKGFMFRGFHFKSRLPLSLLLLPFFLATSGGLTGCTNRQVAPHSGGGAPAQTTVTSATPVPVDPAVAATDVRAEQIRMDCIQGRRLICGRVLKVTPTGLVIDSGYTDLLRPPLGQSWVIPGTVTASRDPNVLERDEPGAPAIGLVFLTDIPKRGGKPKNFDFVVLIGYPAGQYIYTPAPGVEKPVRRFAAGLASAVKLILMDEEKNSPTDSPSAK